MYLVSDSGIIILIILWSLGSILLFLYLVSDSGITILIILWSLGSFTASIVVCVESYERV